MKAVIPAVFQCLASKENNPEVLVSLWLFTSANGRTLQNFKQSVWLLGVMSRCLNLYVQVKQTPPQAFTVQVEKMKNRLAAQNKKMYFSYHGIYKMLLCAVFVVHFSQAARPHCDFLLIKVLFLTLLPTICVKPWWLWQLSPFSYTIFVFTPTVSAIL